MRPGVLTAQLPARGREPFRWEFASSAAILALALAVLIAGLAEPGSVQTPHRHGFSAWDSIAQWTLLSEETAARRQPCMKSHGVAPHEWAAIAGASSTVQLHSQGLVGRGRTRLQPDTQTVLRLLRERQDAIITALTHRMREAPELGAASHAADRPLIVTRPLRGPPASG